MLNSKLAGAVVGMALALATTGTAEAAKASVSEVDFTNGAFAQVSGPTSIPVGHAEFCQHHRSECGRNSKVVAAEQLSDTSWQELVAVNSAFNILIVPVTDTQLYQLDEYWTYPEGFGDCEDIALAKRRQLIEDGWDVSTLLLTVVRQSNGEGHAVLMVRTDRGDLVLDNQDGMVKLWTDTPYQYLKRQSQTNAGQWVDIVDSHAIVVASN